MRSRTWFCFAVGFLVILFYQVSCSGPQVKTSNEEASPELPGGTPAPTVSPSPSPSPEPGGANLESQFESLPRKQAVEKASEEEIHHGPPGLSQGAKIVGDVTEEMKRNPSGIPDGVAFFQRCAKDDQVLSSVRAVCLKRARQWAPKAKLSINLAEYSAEIRALSEKLP